MKYKAIKLKHFNYWIWFKTSEINTSGLTFKGANGWGKSGARTTISVPAYMIEGSIDSEELQYT